MKKILLVISELPYPKHKSGTATTLYNLCEEWNKSNNIEIIYYDVKSKEAEEYFEEIGIKVMHINLVENKNKYFSKASGSISLKPRNSFRYDFSKLENISVDSYDLVILAGFTSGYLVNYLKDYNETKVVFFELDCLSLLYYRYSQASNNILKKLYYYSQFRLIRNTEKYFYEKVNNVLFVSEVDKEHCKRHFGKDNMQKFKNIVNGVEVYKGNTKSKDAQSINIGFSGILDYTPNLNAVNFIVENIVGNAIKNNEKIIFHIIGKNPPASLKQYVDKFNNKLIVTGFVEDINDYISSMDIYISPLFVGTGMKNKILQAMNLGVPIICTSVSTEGISELVDQENCIICDSHRAEDWIRQIEYLAKNKEKRESFSNATKEIISKNYSWAKVANDFINKSLSN